MWNPYSYNPCWVIIAPCSWHALSMCILRSLWVEPHLCAEFQPYWTDGLRVYREHTKTRTARCPSWAKWCEQSLYNVLNQAVRKKLPHSSEMLTYYNPLQRPTNLFHGAFGQFAKVLVCLTFSATQLSKQKYNSIITILALTTPQSSAKLWSIKMSRSTIRVTLVRLVLAWPAAKGCSTKIKNAVPRKLFNQIRRRRQVSVWNVELSNVGVIVVVVAESNRKINHDASVWRKRRLRHDYAIE